MKREPNNTLTCHRRLFLRDKIFGPFFFFFSSVWMVAIRVRYSLVSKNRWDGLSSRLLGASSAPPLRWNLIFRWVSLICFSCRATSCHVVDIICENSSSAGVSRHRTSISIRLDIVSSRTARNGYLSSGWVDVLQTFVMDCTSSSTLLSVADNNHNDDASLSTKGWRCLMDGLFPASACQPYCTQSPGRKAKNSGSAWPSHHHTGQNLHRCAYLQHDLPPLRAMSPPCIGSYLSWRFVDVDRSVQPWRSSPSFPFPDVWGVTWYHLIWLLSKMKLCLLFLGDFLESWKLGGSSSSSIIVVHPECILQPISVHSCYPMPIT